MALNEEFKKQALKFAEKIYNSIDAASKDPSVVISGEALKIYEDLRDWRWFDGSLVEEEKLHKAIISLIAMQQYKHLRWKKEHPVKKVDKPTKWEIVTGKAIKKS